MNTLKFSSILFLALFAVTQSYATYVNCNAYCISKGNGGLIKKLEAGLLLSADEIITLQTSRQLINIDSFNYLKNRCNYLLFKEFSETDTEHVAKTKASESILVNISPFTGKFIPASATISCEQETN